MMFWWCLGVVLWQILFMFWLMVVRSNQRKSEPVNVVTHLTILVPFHNESERIRELINSLNNVSWVDNMELIFVDDHSTDNTAKIIESTLKHPHKVISNHEKKGKKRAIREGVFEAKHPFILTWDADISFGKNYWRSIQKLPQYDVLSLPINVCSTNMVSAWAKIEAAFLRLLQEGFAGMNKPILASGANLFFRKEAFITLDEIRKDYDLVSGDDVFLLQLMTEKGYSSGHIIHRDFEVNTWAPITLSAWLSQRRRWSSKLFHLNWYPFVLPGLTLIVVQIAIICSLVMVWWDPIWLTIIGLKIGVEWMIGRLYGPLGWRDLSALLIQQVSYPFILLISLWPLPQSTRWR
jgi:glycosyltransferase involved in cell wall biosynthesis